MHIRSGYPFSKWSWGLFTIIPLLLGVLPLALLLSQGLFLSWDKVFLSYSDFFSTILLQFWVGLLATALGVLLAWWVSVFQFPGRAFFEWAVILPMAFPGYILGFVYLTLLDRSGFVPQWLAVYRLSPFWEFRNPAGLVFCFVLSLTPYVYLNARHALHCQLKEHLEASSSLGISVGQSFFKVFLPQILWPALGGTLLVLLEVSTDYALVSLFNYPSISTVVFKTWFSYYDFPSAIGWVFLWMPFALVLFAAKLWVAKKTVISFRGPDCISDSRVFPKKPIQWLLSGFFFFFFCFSVAFPSLCLLLWSLKSIPQFDWRDLGECLRLIGFQMGLALVIVGVTLFFSLIKRNQTQMIFKFFCFVPQLGYAMPGVFVALGCYFLYQKLTGVFENSLLLLGFAYLVRFYAVSDLTLNSSLSRMPKNLEMASVGLGVSDLKALKKLYVPILKGTLFSCWVLTVVDILKEVPMTLLLRPIGWESLATLAFQATSEGDWKRAALPSLFLVLTSFVALGVLSSTFFRSGRKS